LRFSPGPGCRPQKGIICVNLRPICVICVSQYGSSLDEIYPQEQNLGPRMPG
jgi:hypothetical protein